MVIKIFFAGHFRNLLSAGLFRGTQHGPIHFGLPQKARLCPSREAMLLFSSAFGVALILSALLLAC